MVTHVCGGTCRVRGCLRPFTAAGLASSYVLCMVGATWHDDVDIDAIEVFVTAQLDGPEKAGLFGFINLGSRV